MEERQSEIYTRQDRDLLVSINTKLERVIKDVQELKDNYAQRLHIVELGLINIDKVKLAKDEQDGINAEMRKDIDNLKFWRWYLVGVAAFSVPVLAWLAYELVNHLMK